MCVKVFLAVVICKIAYFTGKLIGKGSSLPGKFTLKLFPGVLEQLKLPDTIVAVTGSNGKTTTTELIVRALEANGKHVAWNREGSNQTEGVATLLLRTASLGGRVKRDAVVIECDERYAKKIFEKVRPSILVITNLCRDQLTRNGHPEFILDCLHAALNVCRSDGGTAAAETPGGYSGGVKLVLNADDPYVASLAAGETLWFGIGSDAAGLRVRTGMYDDGAFCPVCKEPMSYSYRTAGHDGGYKCSSCAHKRPDPDVEVKKLDLQTGEITFKDDTCTHLPLPGLAGAYNLCAAIAAAKAAGIQADEAKRALDGFALTGGRTVRFTLNEREGFLLISKHENSYSYNHSLSWGISRSKPCTVVILVDAISRKYYTSETSWLWDVDFDLLTDDNVQNIVLAGRYVNELAARFSMTAVDPEKIGYVANPGDLRKYVEKNTTGDIYAVTCFSDKAKLLKAFR